MTAPNLQFDRLRSTEEVWDEKPEAEGFDLVRVFTIPGGEPITDAQIAALFPTGTVMPTEWGGPDLTSRAYRVDDPLLHSAVRRRRKTEPQTGSPAGEVDEVVVTYRKINVTEGTRSTVTGSKYIETSKGPVRSDLGVNLGFRRSNLDGFITWTTFGISTIANDPGAPIVGDSRAFSVNLVGVTGSSPNQIVQVTAANAFTTSTPAAGSVIATTLTANVSERAEIPEWEMGRFLVKTVWRAWVPLAITTQGSTTFLMKSRQELGWQLQIRGLSIGSTVEWSCRHTSSVHADFLAAYPKGSALPTNGGSANPEGQVLVAYKIITNTLSGEDEITAEYGTYVGGGGGLIGAGYLLPFSNIKQDFAVMSADSHVLDVPYVASDRLYRYTAISDWSIGGLCLDFEMSPMTSSLRTVLLAIKDKSNTDSTAGKVPVGALCTEYACNPGRAGMTRVRVYFAYVIGGTCRKQEYIGGIWWNTSDAAVNIAVAAPQTSFAGLNSYILSLA